MGGEGSGVILLSTEGGPVGVLLLFSDVESDLDWSFLDGLPGPFRGLPRPPLELVVVLEAADSSFARAELDLLGLPGPRLAGCCGCGCSIDVKLVSEEVGVGGSKEVGVSVRVGVCAVLGGICSGEGGSSLIFLD